MEGRAYWEQGPAHCHTRADCRTCPRRPARERARAREPAARERQRAAARHRTQGPGGGGRRARGGAAAGSQQGRQPHRVQRVPGELRGGR